MGADYWGAYRTVSRLFDVRIQYCMAHLIREIRFLAEHSAKAVSLGDKTAERAQKTV